MANMNPKKMKRVDNINIRIAPEIKEKVETLAAARGLTMSSYIAALLGEQIAQTELLNRNLSTEITKQLFQALGPENIFNLTRPIEGEE